MKTLKVLSALLDYPTKELQEASSELKAVLRSEALLGRSDLEALCALIDDIASRDILDVQERYVLLFDRTRSLSLHLFEHVHGESRDRGQAMVDLLQVYEKAGWQATASELPDYLPMFLEYASTRPPVEAMELVGQPGHVLAALRERLARRQSPYESVFAALVSLADAKLDAAELNALRAEPDPEPDDLKALDELWQEEEVTFGPGAASDCGVDSLAAKIRQAARPAPGLDPPRRGGPATIITASSAERS
ncbi:MAG: nitrate reductase molybdenum cofactor assembly chaperone [Hyphomicrobiaceae bacterium]